MAGHAVMKACTCMGQADVDEALRLMTMSKISLHDDEGRRKTVADPISAIYGRIREDILRHEKDTYSWEEVVALCGSYTVSICHGHTWLNDFGDKSQFAY